MFSSPSHVKNRQSPSQPIPNPGTSDQNNIWRWRFFSKFSFCVVWIHLLQKRCLPFHGGYVGDVKMRKKRSLGDWIVKLSFWGGIDRVELRHEFHVEWIPCPISLDQHMYPHEIHPHFYFQVSSSIIPNGP